MRDLAVEHDRHGFEAAMRVRAHASTVLGRGKICRPGVIQQQKGADSSTMFLVRKQLANGEAVANPMHGFGRGMDADDLPHGRSSFFLYLGPPSEEFKYAPDNAGWPASLDGAFRIANKAQENISVRET
jgi:hypothetical protein